MFPTKISSAVITLPMDINSFCMGVELGPLTEEHRLKSSQSNSAWKKFVQENVEKRKANNEVHQYVFFD